MKAFILEFYCMFFEFLIFYVAIQHFHTQKKKHKHNFWYTIVSLYLLSSFIRMFITDTIIAFVFNLLCHLLCLNYVFKKQLIDLLYTFSLSYCIMFLIQICIVIPMGLTADTLTAESSMIIGNALTLLCIILLCKLIPLHAFYQYIGKIHKNIKLILSNCFLLIASIMLYSKLSSDTFFDSFMLVILCCFVIIFFNIHTLYYTQRMEQQRVALEAYEQYLPIVNELIDFVRARQHNFDNQLSTLRGLPLNHHTYEDLAKALNQNIDTVTSDSNAAQLLSLNKKLVAGFLFNKYFESQKNNQLLTIQLKTSTLPDSVPEYTLIEMMGILIDNALEASPQDMPVYFTLSMTKENRLSVCCQNFGPQITPEFRRNIFKKGYTTKEDPDHCHGLGLYTLKKLLTQYHITIRLENETIENQRYITFELTL